jgi:16S rRNA processing protein RimM
MIMTELHLGWIKKLRGARGELLVAMRSEDPARYLGLPSARFARPGEPRQARPLASVRIHGANLIIRPEGVESGEAAARWLGLEVWVDAAVLPALEPPSYYAWQLMGFEVVTTAGERIGRLGGVHSTGGCDLWVVNTPGGREHLIPAAASICTRVDVELGRITIDPPEGLLDLDAI